MALVKPQFESGRAAVGKRGVVKRPETHRAVLRQIAAFVRNETDFALMGLDVSPIQGPEGNVNFLCSAVVERRGWIRMRPRRELNGSSMWSMGMHKALYRENPGRKKPTPRAFL